MIEEFFKEISTAMQRSLCKRIFTVLYVIIFYQFCGVKLFLVKEFPHGEITLLIKMERKCKKLFPDTCIKGISVVEKSLLHAYCIQI